MHPAVAVLFYLCYTFAISCYSHHALLFAAGGNCRAAAEATGGFKMDQINETGTNNTDKSKKEFISYSDYNFYRDILSRR